MLDPECWQRLETVGGAWDGREKRVKNRIDDRICLFIVLFVCLLHL